MPVRVLVVDDSRFFRRQITKIIEEEAQFKVIGVAADGKEAVAKTVALKPDVITMDVEMPVMNGISATREIMTCCPTPILMFSSLTHDGAKSTLDALEAGAVDFLPKRFEDIAHNKQEAKILLRKRLLMLAKRNNNSSIMTAISSEKKRENFQQLDPLSDVARKLSNKLEILVIGTSTGGPVALQKVITQLPADFPLPILLVQHMPGTFTPTFAKRLDQLCMITVTEANDGDQLESAHAYLAPGGQQMMVTKQGDIGILQVAESNMGETYKPSIDITFSSVANSYGGDVLAIILTGMGNDGREGSRALKQKGASIWAQDEATSVIYGMPAAIVDAGLADEILAISDIASRIAREVYS